MMSLVRAQQGEPKAERSPIGLRSAFLFLLIGAIRTDIMIRENGRRAVPLVLAAVAAGIRVDARWFEPLAAGAACCWGAKYEQSEIIANRRWFRISFVCENIVS